MKIAKYPAVYYSRDGEHITTLFAETPVNLVSQLKSIQRDEPCDTTCMRVCVASPRMTGYIRMWQMSFGNVDRYTWYIDVDDFQNLMLVKYIDAEEAYYDTVVR